MTHPRPHGLAILLIAAVLPRAWAGEASNDQKVRCASAYEQAQRTRREGLLRASREHLLVCAEDSCPSVLRNDCVRWLSEVEAATPTLLFVAKDESGADVVDVSVTIDGTRVLDRLEGKALPVDPGTHTFRFVRAGSDAIEQKLLIREGEKRRAITVTFDGGKSGKPDEPPSSSTSSSDVPAATWLLGSLGVVAVGASIGLYVVGGRQKADLDAKRCSPACDPADVDPVKRTYVYGDVALGIGVAAFAGATLFYLARPSKSASVGVAPTRGGVATSFTMRF